MLCAAWAWMEEKGQLRFCTKSGYFATWGAPSGGEISTKLVTSVKVRDVIKYVRFELH
jgi:hypothetical protein